MTAAHQAVKGDPVAALVRGRTKPADSHPIRLRSYALALVLIDVVLIAHWATGTRFRTADVLTALALLGCGAVCIEATRRLGVPAGVSRDLLSAWWLPAALLLPPLYAVLIPIPVNVLLQLRVRRTLVIRRVVSTAAVGIAGATASVLFHTVVPDPLTGPIGWLTGGPGVSAAVGAGVVFTVLNTALVAAAAHSAVPDTRWRDVLWDQESLLLDVVELCVGVMVAILCALGTLLLVLALPPVILLQRSLLHQQLQAAARMDAKTGLLNAAAWQREADIEISHERRDGDAVALLILDIDHFKQVNDMHGHLIGDQVLAGVAATLTNQLRAADVVGRFGGEEFVVLLPRTDLVEACRVAERLRTQIGRMAVPAEHSTVSITVSVGVALLRTHGEDLIELLTAADMALYRAKESGRDRVCLPGRGGDGAAAERLTVQWGDATAG
ncbi:MAG: diguanylate cyclase [Streptosporangiales bacterium]|nr:diguanylate cyclase [Streptosporangiales bacterium]